MPFEEIKEVAYTTSAAAKGGREGHVKSADGVVDLDLRKPGSQSNPQANPETLFAAGFAGCFSGALNLVAGKEGLDTSESTVTAEVAFGPAGDSFGLAVTLTADIPGVDKDKAQELVEKAHQVCPYSKATRDNIKVTVQVA